MNCMIKTIFITSSVWLCLTTLTVNVNSSGISARTAFEDKATAGIWEVTRIEAKAKKIVESKEALEKLKGEIAKPSKLNQELANLYKERDDLLRDLKGGFYCSKCGKAKSEFEKAGEDFEKHLGEVKGVAVPASTARLEEVRESYKSKIAYKKVQIQNYEKQYSALLDKKNADIARLESEISHLCEEITALSKTYERKVADEINGMHKGWVRDLMDHASRILIPEDQIVIYQARIAAYRKEFEIQSLEVREEVKRQNEQEQEAKNSKIAQNQQEMQALEERYKEAVAPLETKLSEITRQIDHVNAELRKADLTDAARTSLTEERSRLIEQAAAVEKSIAENKDVYEAKDALLRSDIRRLQAELAELVAGLFRRQEAEVAKLSAALQQKTNDSNEVIESARAALGSANTAYRERVEYYTGINSKYHDVVSTESDRMMLAGKEIDCPIWNGARGEVARNWHDIVMCVNTIPAMAKPSSTHVFGSYCPSVASSDNLTIYINFLSGLNDADKQAVKSNSNVGWFNGLLN